MKRNRNILAARRLLDYRGKYGNQSAPLMMSRLFKGKTDRSWELNETHYPPDPFLSKKHDTRSSLDREYSQVSHFRFIGNCDAEALSSKFYAETPCHQLNFPFPLAAGKYTRPIKLKIRGFLYFPL